MPLHRKDLVTLARDPALRLQDRSGADQLVASAELHPHDPYLHELLELVVAEQALWMEAYGNAFTLNTPPKGTFPPIPKPGHIPLTALETGDVLSEPLEAKLKNTIVTGPTGGGKTNVLRAQVLSCVANGATTVVFDQKGDFTQCQSLESHPEVVEVSWNELQYNPLQVPDGVDERSFISNLTELYRRQGHLYASKRLLLETLHRVFAEARQKNKVPVFQDWINAVRRVPVKRQVRGYQEAALALLTTVKLTLGEVLECERSDAFDRITQHRGCVVIKTVGLDPEMASLLISLIVDWVFQARGVQRTVSDRPVLFFLDDALNLVHGGIRQESEEGTNPIATWSLLGRSRGIGLIVSCQNFALMSPALRSNTETIVCCGSTGRDAEELARHLHLNREQHAALSVMQPGEVVVWARGQWPLPVYGRIPLVP